MDAAIQVIWHRSIPQTRERLLVLQRAAEQLSSTRTLDPELRAEAYDLAHKLAGSLGMFGLHQATDLAREIEGTLDHLGLPQPERLEEQVNALSAALQPHLKED